jgi:hypothetical protein
MAKQTFTTGQVLTAAQMTSLQQTAMLGGAASAKTASYTLVAADAGTAISMSSASATTITVNTALFAAGDTVQITNLGAGVCTITAGTATVNTSASLALAQYESGTLNFTSTSAAIFIKGAGTAAGGGGMTLLSTTTLSGASTTISSISQDYTNLYIVATNVYSAAGNSLYCRFNGDDTAANYNTSNTLNNAGTISGNVDLDNGYIGATGTGTAWDTLTSFEISIPRYSSTQNHRTMSELRTKITGQRTYSVLHAYSSTTAISSIKFASDSTFTAGTVYLYGVK